MSISLQMLWLVSGIGAVVLSTGAAAPRRLTGLLMGFAVAVWVLRGGSVPDPATVAGFTAIVAGAKIYRPSWTTLAAFGGGILTGVFGAALQAQDVPAIVALPVAAAIPAAVLTFSARNANFAPAAVLEESLLLLLALSLAAAVGPPVWDGWRSAAALNVSAAETVTHALPAWVLSAAGASLCIGGAASLWRHR